MNTLAEKLAEHIIDGMDLKTLMQFAYESLLNGYADGYADMSEEDLAVLAQEFAPHLVEDHEEPDPNPYGGQNCEEDEE